MAGVRRAYLTDLIRVLPLVQHQQHGDAVMLLISLEISDDGFRINARHRDGRRPDRLAEAPPNA